MWKAASVADGRRYYYQEGTQNTTWEKPEDFIESEAEAPQPDASSNIGSWVAAKSEDDRTYYYNDTTKATRWDQPPGYQPPQTPVTATPQSNNNSNGNFVADRRIELRDNFRDTGSGQRGGFGNARPGGRSWESRGEGTGYRGALPSKTDEPAYATPAEAEAAFFKFLKSQGITYDTNWKDVIRAVGREKGFRAFKDPRERRQAFDKFCADEKVAEKTREQERVEKQRESFRSMLRLHEEITPYTRWKTARPLIERELVFRNVQDGDEQKQMFREYTAELQKRRTQEETTTRQRALAELSALMRTIVPSSDIRWQEALQKIEGNKHFAKDTHFRTLTKTDVLRAYESHVKIIDTERNDVKQRQKQNQYRGQREARDGFKDLLREQLQADHIRATTKWKDFYPRIAEDKRYQDLLAVPGSTPLDLFWDLVEDEDRRLRSKRNIAYDVLEAHKYEMRADTEFDEFEGLMRGDNRTRDLSTNDLRSIYDKLVDKVKRREQESRVLAERNFHHAVDALRSAIKHLRPAIHGEDKYEDVATKIEALPEARGLDEDARRTAYDKHIKRLQEKALDREKDRARRDRDKEQRNGSRRSYDDDRDRDLHNRERSPELDAYEEDRRKAQAVRERQYRKASFGLTPPPRDRRDDRGDRRDRYESVYERERKERELERERSYMSRADPRDRGKISMLDYGDDDTGDSIPGSTRKRRESEVSTSSKRDSKRARRSGLEESASAPQPMDVDKDEPALQSGSEEGEIEEV